MSKVTPNMTEKLLTGIFNNRLVLVQFRYMYSQSILPAIASTSGNGSNSTKLKKDYLKMDILKDVLYLILF